MYVYTNGLRLYQPYCMEITVMSRNSPKFQVNVLDFSTLTGLLTDLWFRRKWAHRDRYNTLFCIDVIVRTDGRI